MGMQALNDDVINMEIQKRHLVTSLTNPLTAGGAGDLTVLKSVLSL